MKNILVLISDLKGKESNSYAIFNKIKNILDENNYKYHIVLINDEFLNNDIELKRLIKKTEVYSNIILITNMQENKLSNNTMDFLEKLLHNKERINKDIMFSVIINYNYIDIKNTEIHLNYCESIIKKIGLKWQKGIGATLQQNAWKEDLKKNKKRYSPLIVELEFLCANIESNKKCYEHSFVTPFMPKSIFQGLSKLNSLKEKYCLKK
ncbi:hypothetical protein [Clostridium tarantellae]|uniref:Uncharacterized protein n=1 Tax=Clostridium tarantellae TaxID=39493 RepID=A0A6I1MWF3_9CLOT|nr:hypothetical protein [Clostridium tarantellae]MPQ45141.1 hypothetical protein [Clostridium tarantellae]